MDKIVRQHVTVTRMVILHCIWLVGHVDIVRYLVSELGCSTAFRTASDECAGPGNMRLSQVTTST